MATATLLVPGEEETAEHFHLHLSKQILRSRYYLFPLFALSFRVSRVRPLRAESAPWAGWRVQFTLEPTVIYLSLSTERVAAIVISIAIDFISIVVFCSFEYEAFVATVCNLGDVADHAIPR